MTPDEFSRILRSKFSTTALVEALDTHFWQAEDIVQNQSFRAAALVHLCREYEGDPPTGLIALVDALHMRTASYNKHAR